MKKPCPAEAVIVVLVGVVVSALFCSDLALTAARGVEQPLARSVLTGVLTPVDTVARTLRLHAPRQAVEALAGKEKVATDSTDPSGLSARAKRVERHPSRVASASGTRREKNVRTSYISVPRMPSSLTERLEHKLGKKRPLRILFTGDSTAYEPGWAAARRLPKRLARVSVTSFTGTGLLRPDAFDWRLKAESQVRSYRPDIVLVFMGPNDFYPLEGYGITHRRWASKYAARIQVVMDAYAGDRSRLVLWAPPAIDGLVNSYMPSTANRTIRSMHRAVREAASAVPGGGHLDTYRLFSRKGRYSQTVRNPVSGRLVSGVRRSDGTHLTAKGGRIVADVLGSFLEKRLD